MLHIRKIYNMDCSKRFISRDILIINTNAISNLIGMICLVLFILTSITSCHGDDDILVLNTGVTQGTFYHIKYISLSGKDYRYQIDSLLAEIDSSLSTYKDYSLISRINRGEKVKVDKKFKDVFYAAEQIYFETNGGFDCSIAPLTNYWGFGSEDEPLYIDSIEVKRRLDLVDYSRLEIHNDSILLPQGMQLDYNAIAQGYSVDIISLFLEKKGVENYLVEIGGEIRAKGKNAENNLWLVGLDKPVENNHAQEELQLILEIENSSLATSGNYRKFRVVDGVKYSHTISTETGFFAENRMISVSVIHSSCMFSDAYATAFMAMGVSKSKAFVNSRSDLDVYFLYTDKDNNWEVFMTEKIEEITKK